VRAGITQGNKKRAEKRFELSGDKKTLLVFGGGGGALWINERIKEALSKLCPKYNVIHVTGLNQTAKMEKIEGYFVQDLLNEEEMADAWSISDVAVIRGGMGSLTEMSSTGTIGIIVPLPGSQTINAKIFAEAKEALLFDQKKDSGESFIALILSVLENPAKYKSEQQNKSHVLQTDSASKIAKKLKGLIKNTPTP